MDIYDISCDSVQDAIIKINSARKEQKDKWFQINLILWGVKYQFKIYNTWIQIATCEKVTWRDSSPTDISVKEFKSWIEKFFAKCV